MHIAIIVDGNRRWARKQGLKPWNGHDAGLKKLQKIIKKAFDLGVKELTFYVFSAQNINRAKTEVNRLFFLLKKSCRDLLEDKELNKRNVRIRFIGNRKMFPRELQSLMNQVEKKTKNYDKYFLNFATGYGGREELTDSVRQIAAEVKQGKLNPSSISQKTIAQHLWLQSEPDIVIRTGGEMRTSNYLPWQSIYSEWFFLKKMWPDFTAADLKRILSDFNKRNRRFGK